MKVVGAVLRHTVGYANQFGPGRRQQAPLSYSYIQQYTKLSDRSTLSEALRRAVDSGYIRCVDAGRFHPSPHKRRPATYSIRWLGEGDCGTSGSETRPAAESRSKNPTSDGSETRPAERFRNQTKEKTPSNDTPKQQQAVVAEDCKAVQLLREAGFDQDTSRRIAQAHSTDEIKQQIEWLDKRNPQQNPLGLLRRAIEETWEPPSFVQQQIKEDVARERERQREAEEAADEERRRRLDAERCGRWLALPKPDRERLRQAAIEHAHPRARKVLEKQTIDGPARSFLIEMDRADA